MKNIIAGLAGAVLLSVPHIVYADPPSGTLAEVNIRTATETVRGHITYGWQDVPSPDEYLSGKDYSDSASLREIVKKRGSAQLMLDLIRVATPRAMYVFSSERTF